MIEQTLVRATILISALVFIGLCFTYLFAGHKIKGLMLSAFGILISTIGYLSVFLLRVGPGQVYLSNIILVLGTMLFYLSTYKGIDQKVNLVEATIFFGIYAITLAIFVFVFEEINVRQTLVSVAIIYIASRIITVLYDQITASGKKYLYAYVALSCVLILLQTVRLFLIALDINNQIVGTTGITANIYILIFTGLTFVTLAFALLVATSVYIRRQLSMERKLLEEWSNTDYLTKLPNRRRLFDYIQERIDMGEKFAVVMTDIDGFKAINDTFGHPVGDAVLIAYATIINARKGHHNFVARFGGDEFVFVLSDYESKEDVLNHIETSFHLSNIIVHDKKYDFTIKSSAGVALFLEDGIEPSELIKKADHALYLVKTSNRKQVGFFEN